MAVTLIATVVALVLGHMAPSLAASVRQYGWYGDWLRGLDARFGDGSFWRARCRPRPHPAPVRCWPCWSGRSRN